MMVLVKVVIVEVLKIILRILQKQILNTMQKLILIVDTNSSSDNNKNKNY